MPGQSAVMKAGLRRAGSTVLRNAALVLVVAMVASVGTTFVDGPTARASVMAADAASYVPTLANLPPGYREESVAAEGGDLNPTIGLRRTFVSQDGGRRVTVDVALGSSVQDAHTMLGARMNQLIQYYGWRITPNAPFGEAAFRGNGVLPDGNSGALIAFRIQAVTAEIVASSTTGDIDVPLLDNLARLVERRISEDPDAVAFAPGFPVDPVKVPGKDPVIPAAVAVGPGGVLPPGAEVTGSSSGSPVQGDTIVMMTVTGFDRPWQAGGGVPAPAANMEYMTVETQIEAVGHTEVAIALTDFWVSTFDGRSWTPVSGRGPSLQPGAVVIGTPARGWLTFMLPRDQPALQITWRIRTRQPLSGQGNVEQTLVIPLTVGATASASVGETAPPAGVPVVPPSSAPTGPTGPASPSGPTIAPGGNGGGSGGGSGGSSPPRGGTRLQ
jgi:hypothetical protein